MYRMRVEATTPLSGEVKVYALRNDYALRGALKMAHNAWKENTKEERAAGHVSKWYDFRIDYGLGENVSPTPHVAHANAMLTGITTTNVGGVNISNPAHQTYTSGEFELSEVQSEDTGLMKSFTLKTSPLSSQWSILQEYSLKGNVDVDAPPEIDVPYAGLQTTIDPAIASHLQSDGDGPPYNESTYAPASPWVHVATLRTTADGRLMSTGFLDVPCGVLVFEGDFEDMDLCVEFQQGDYKGVNSWPIV